MAFGHHGVWIVVRPSSVSLRSMYPPRVASYSSPATSPVGKQCCMHHNQGNMLGPIVGIVMPSR